MKEKMKERTTEVQGSANIYFSGERFILYDAPSGTITWSKSAGAPFTFSPSTGDTTYVSKIVGSSGGGYIHATVNGITYSKYITVYDVAISGPNELNWGGSATYSLPDVAGASYSWKTGYLLYISGSTTGYSALVYAPSTPGPDTTDKVFCSVTLNGVLTSLQTPVIEIE